jgi:amino acid adenylation domain-containing protein
MLLTNGDLSSGIIGPRPVLHVHPDGSVDSEATGAGRPSDQADSEPARVYVMFTSGTTGVPKGVRIPESGLVNRLLWMRHAYGLRPADRVLHKSTLGFDVAVWEVFAPLLVGATIVLCPAEAGNNVEAVAELIEKEGVTVLDAVPSLLRAMTRQRSTLDSLRSVRAILCGGEVLEPELARQIGEFMSSGRLYNTYGATETTIGNTWYDCSSLPPDASDVPVGRPIDNTVVRVLDYAGRPAPVYAPGEIYIGGAGVALGFLPGSDQDSLTDDPATGGRLYRTEDIGWYDENGLLHVLGRVTAANKLRGQRLDLNELAAALRAHPAVREAVAAVKESSGPSPVLVAYVTVSFPVDTSELRLFVRDKVPAVLVPAAVLILAEFPLLPSGKLDLQALPAPRPGARTPVGEAMPGTPTEKRLAAMWAELLERDEIGVDEEFFEIGGHSLLAVEMVTRARAEFDVTLPLREVFHTRTIAALAALIDQRLATGGGGPG